MKIDMSSEAITLRLKQVSRLRSLCLSLADGSAGRDARRKLEEKAEQRAREIKKEP